MKKLLVLCLFLLWPLKPAAADDNAFFKLGPLSLEIPFKTTRAVYMFDFKQRLNLVGAETPIAQVWNRVEGTVGVVTSLEGQGTPFVGGNILLGNIVEKFVTLPSDLAIGGYGGWNFHSELPIYGVKASIRLW